jgi:hypothetical protein
MTAPPNERLSVALAGAAYFAAEAALDHENSDRDELCNHLRHLRLIVISALKAYKELPALPWPDATTRAAFGCAAAEWREDRDHRDPIRDHQVKNQGSPHDP